MALPESLLPRWDPSPDARQDAEAIPHRLVGPVGRREDRFGLLEQHGRGLAGIRVGAALIQAEAGEGTDNALCKHLDNSYCSIAIQYT